MIIQIIITLFIISIVSTLAMFVRLFYGFSIDQSIGAAIGIVGLPVAYILSIGAAVNKHFSKSTKKSSWTVVKPGHAIRNS